jgi:hypothetical protein
MSATLHVDDPFEDSLSVLALAAMQDAGAVGVACFRYAEAGEFLRVFEFGSFIEEPAHSDLGAPTTVRFPLHREGVHDAILAFRFSTKEQSDAIRDRLVRFVVTIQKVWEAQSIPQSYRKTMECIIDMEMKLADSKIASHVRGVLRENAGRTSADAIFRHVETVLRPSSTMRALNQIHRELQEKVEERNWTVRAKTILQDSRGMTEEEAYSQLRKFSRQSRKRFAEIARDVVEGRI